MQSLRPILLLACLLAGCTPAALPHTWTVDATLIARTASFTAVDIHPYRDAMIVHRYRTDAGLIDVAHRLFRDGKRIPGIDNREPGRIYTLHVGRLDDHRARASMLIRSDFDRMGADEVPLLLDMAPNDRGAP